MRLYIGLDVHHRTSTFCVIRSDDHRVVNTVTVKGGRHRLLEQLRRINGDIHICYEASLGYGTLHEQLAAFCQRVVVAHPGRLRMIFRSKRKNDRVDAKKLAKLLLLDEVPQVHVPSIDCRAWRELIEFRRRLIDHRTRCKNGLRALLRGLALEAPGALWTRAGRAFLVALELPTPAAAMRRDMLLEQLDHLRSQIKHVTAELDRVAHEHPGVALLQTIPGIGPRTAETYLAYIDDARRFARVKRVGAYLGLVPCQDASATVNRLGHITKEGPATLRKYLVEAAWQVIRRCPHMRDCFNRIAQDKADRRKIALVAVAHKLAQTMLAMLKSGETYRAPAPATGTAHAATAVE